MLRIELTGRIDTSNASEVESRIMEEIGPHGDDRILFDAENLSYISSAGLRILMKIRKSTGKTLDIVNVSRDVYDIFETTGFTELFSVKKAYRKLDVDGLEVIGRGFFGTVYRIDDESIVKVYKGKDSIPMIENEKKMAQKAFLHGIPTAISFDIVKVGDDYGSVFELLNARTFNELVQRGDEPLEDIIKRYTDLIKLVHQTKPETGELPSYRERFLGYLEVIKKHLSREQYERLKALLENVGDENTLVHGDIQMKNVMMGQDGPMLIDMDTLGLGNPVFEFAGLYVTYKEFEEDDPDNAMSFLGIPGQTADDIWDGVIDSYFDHRDQEERRETVNRIALTAAVRFLYLIESTDLKDDKFGKIRIEHTRQHIEELLRTVTSLKV